MLQVPNILTTSQLQPNINATHFFITTKLRSSPPASGTFFLIFFIFHIKRRKSNFKLLIELSNYTSNLVLKFWWAFETTQSKIKIAFRTQQAGTPNLRPNNQYNFHHGEIPHTK
jgi:hypothetical protein